MNEISAEPHYWVVGATWGGTDDVLPTFITRGYWYCWDIGEAPSSTSDAGNSVATQRDRFLQIKPDDRIAVKKMLGRGASDMDIRAIGVVKDIDQKEWRVYVTWLIEHEHGRRVPLRGCTASIHGPYSSDDPWIRRVFCI